MLSFYRFSHFIRYSSLIHAVTTKSTNEAYHFSLALHTGELAHKIIENRRTVAKALQTDSTLAFIVANQTHSDNITIIDKPITRGWESLSDTIEDCDALITNQPHVALTILTADCVPILLFDPKLRVIAAVHAGWKGTAHQIVKKTIEKMIETFQCNPSDIQAGIGPSIGQCCYEVNKEVVHNFFHMPHTYKKKKEKYMLNLPAINQEQLLNCGVHKDHIEISNICTACHTEDYFSYRKENKCSGRFMSIIALDN